MSHVVVFNNMESYEMTRMTVPEAARYAGKNPETIRRWIREGKLRSEKVGTQHIVSKEDVEWLMPAPLMELPPEWKPDEGPDIDWERIIRESRESH